MIRNSAMTYMNEFVWQDIELTETFKRAYESYLKESNYDVEFLGATAVITSPSAKYIYVPNQWFVIASYVVDVFEELQRYKEYFKKVADNLGMRPDAYAKLLRDSATITDRDTFISCAKNIFASLCSDSAMVEESASRLWRFVTDYAWWSGQKTIDRGDFHMSVILNMLNLVNASQSYVADIVTAYANDATLRMLVRSVDCFTINLHDEESDTSKEYILPDEEIRDQHPANQGGTSTTAIPKPERVRIKINGTSTLKEFKFRG